MRGKINFTMMKIESDFLGTLNKMKEDGNYHIYAYCQMSNHVLKAVGIKRFVIS